MSTVEAGLAREPVGVARQLVELGDGRAIAYAQAGEGPDLLAIHGTLMTLDEMWLGPVPALARHFRVTAVDRPGHGFSRRRRLVDASPWRQAEMIRDAARAFGLARPVLLGHSYGGTVALAYAQLFPDEVAGVVAVAPVCRPEPRLEQLLFGPRAVPGWGAWLAAAAGLTTDRLVLPLLRRAIFLPQAMPPRFAAEFPTSLTDTAEALMIEGEDAVAMAPTMTRFASALAARQVPVRFLGGTADLVINNALNGQLAASLLPEARFTWFAGLGHMLHHFAVDEVVAAALEVASPRAPGRESPVNAA